jgi:hypothetical protein
MSFRHLQDLTGGAAPHRRGSAFQASRCEQCYRELDPACARCRSLLLDDVPRARPPSPCRHPPMTVHPTTKGPAMTDHPTTPDEPPATLGDLVPPPMGQC